ncbi:MAG: Rieske (2Fe-2S) protein [Chloroflexota bacterium]|nr:Rieske (2Fe-2S) protein [Chloroflexota bacterium]MDP9470230.1 Rieske (2Fe-2S) protein [Chloroflexota bacterium]
MMRANTRTDTRNPSVDLPAPELGDFDVQQYSTRRRFLKWMIRIGYGAFALAFALPALALRALQTEQQGIAEGDVLVFASGNAGAQAGTAVKPGDIPEGTGLQVFPQGKTDNQSNLVEVVRIAPGEGVDGLVAYSAICTHLGCAVYAKLNQAGHIACPCHNSQFDPANNAEVVGGPANRPLPPLPLGLGPDGSLIASGPIEGPIGPE